MMTKKENLFLGGIFVILLAVFSFTDLAISQALFNGESLYGKFFEAFGELPGALVAVFCSAALIVTRNKAVKWKSICSVILFGFLLLSFGFMAGVMPINYLGAPMPIAALLAAVFIVAAFFLAKKVDPKQMQSLRRAAIIGILTFVAAIIVINLIKMGWGRMRFRIMDDPAAQFSAWFLPQGFTTDNEFMSFPSGHSANSAVILWITLIPAFAPRFKNSSILLKIIAFAWTALVMFSRIIMGAHFASDVLMGATISIAIFCILSSKLLPIKNSKE